MGQKLDKLMAEMQAELDQDENKSTQTETQESESEPVEKPSEDVPAPQPEESPEPEAEPEPEPTADKPEHRDIPDDPVKRAEFSFRRQLAKKDEKHAKELAERDEKYDKLAKELEEVKKQLAPKEQLKVREDFDNDEDFINYLLDQGIQRGFAKRDEEQAAKEAELKKQQEAQAEEDRELAQKQQDWLDNVDQAFQGDKDRSKKFFDRIAFCNKQGLGEVLDSCPVAADYLVNDPMGPIVFEKMVFDKPTFERIFNPRRLNPMAIYHELRTIEDELLHASQPAPVEAPKPVPHIGRPGRQAGGSSIMSTDMFSDNKAVKQWLKDHR